MVLVTRPDRLEDAWIGLYASLVRRIAGSFPPAVEAILEVGSGRGQITVPLAKSLPDAAITAVDQFKGSYSRDRPTLLARLEQAGVGRRVRVITANALRWLSYQKAGQFGVVLSSEFLPELDTHQIRDFFNGCYRILCPAGVTAHVFLSPAPSNPRQQLVVEADSDPRWTRRPPGAWFSPPPALVLKELTAAGFRNTRTQRYPGGLRARGEAARSMLRRWGVRADFANGYADRLRKDGLELPDWIVALGTKPQ